MYSNAAEIIQAGYNGFILDGKTYKIEFGRRGIVYGCDINNKDNKVAVAATLLDEFIQIPLPMKRYK